MPYDVTTIFGRTSAAYAVARKTFGYSIRPLFIFTGMAYMRLMMVTGTWFDRLFFPIAKTEVKKPIVIIGNHRTGSTFLQRFLHDQGFGSGMMLYQLLYPSLTMQFFIKPFLPLLEAVSPTKHHDHKVHETGMQIVETDDAGMTFRFFDGFFLYGFVLAFLEDEDLLPQFRPEGRDTSARDWPWLQELWKRNLIKSGHTRVISKLFSVTPQTPNFVKQFPDAKVLYLARDPLSVIPSTLSLLEGVLTTGLGYDKLAPEVRERHIKRVYAAIVELMRRFHDDWVSGAIPHDRVLIVRFDRLMAEFEPMMDEICAFCELEMTDAQREAIAKRGEKQRAYKSGHKYDLAKYGLTEEQVLADTKFFYDTFLPPLESSKAAEG
ncbi:MAG: sulfotransferase [Myxococcales bacterium]|nr:sulfotransferase [Myxococcales bacterium]